MNYSLSILALLLPALALGDGPKMGPEIEFRGKKLVPSMVCQTGDYLAGAVAAGGFGSGLYAVAKDEEGKVSSALLPAAAGVGAGAVIFVGCGIISYKDAAAADSYLRKIHESLQPRVAAGELEAKWSGPSSWRKLELEFPDGRKIIFGKDPNVVEVTLSPIRPRELAADLAFYQREIFDAAEAVGLKVPRLDGPWNGGHLHIDIGEAFGGDPVKLKNFFIDFIEHPELAGGVLVKDFYNAPVLDPLKQGPAIEAVVNQLEAWAEKGEKLTSRHLAALAAIGPFSKRDALNINTFYGTIEVRSLRSQKSARELLNVMRLFEARIRHTNSLPEKQFTLKSTDLGRREKARAFRVYVEEAGLDYEEFKQLAPRRYQDGCEGFFSRIMGR